MIYFFRDIRGETNEKAENFEYRMYKTVKRKFDAHNDITDNFPKYVVSLDEFDMSRNGIVHKNIREFLKTEW